MLITCWSSKGGSGTTVVAAALAGLLAADAGDALLVDLGGDLPAVLGLPDPPEGLTTWRVGGPGTSGSSARLRRIEVDAGGGVRLLPRGPGLLGAEVGPALAQALGERERVVVDAGVIGTAGTAPALDLAAAATRSLLVLRPCFLALRRAVAAPIRGSGVVLVDEPQRVLGRGDIQAALGVPVLAVVPWDPAVARRVDAGLLGAALPRAVARALREVVAGAGGSSARPGAGAAPWDRGLWLVGPPGDGGRGGLVPRREEPA